MAFVAFALSTFHFSAAHFGPRPYIVLVLSLVFAEYVLNVDRQNLAESDGHPQHVRALIFLNTEYTFRHWGS
jgi:hypothetical protein